MEVDDVGISTENLGVILVQKDKHQDAIFTPPFSSQQRFRFSWSSAEGDPSAIFRVREADDERLYDELAAWDAASDEALVALEI